MKKVSKKVTSFEMFTSVIEMITAVFSYAGILAAAFSGLSIFIYASNAIISTMKDLDKKEELGKARFVANIVTLVAVVITCCIICVLYQFNVLNSLTSTSYIVLIMKISLIVIPVKTLITTITNFIKYLKKEVK